MPENDAGGDGDVEGVLGAELGNFKAGIGEIDGLLLYSADFVAEDEGGRTVGGKVKVREGNAAFGLLDGVEGVAFGAEMVEGVKGVGEMLPRNGFLGTEGGFVDFAVGRGGGNAAEVEGLEAEGVGGAEDGADVVKAADVVEHENNGGFGGLAVLFGGEAVKFLIE